MVVGYKYVVILKLLSGRFSNGGWLCMEKGRERNTRCFIKRGPETDCSDTMRKVLGAE